MRVVCKPLIALTFLGLALQPTAAGLVKPAEHNRLLAQVNKAPMAFFLAKGGANACGPGCSEWIAADGTIEKGSAQRFREFLDALGRRELPVFFHSRGGYLADGVQIGGILRDRRMTASIGRTMPEHCRIFDRDDDACQQQMKSGVQARLVTGEGQCHSACVYAFIGASNRQVPPGALVGVHSPHQVDNGEKSKKLPVKKSSAEQLMSRVHQLGKQYLLQSGVSPDLEDLMRKVDPRRIYLLSRDEIARFGIETRDIYETQWMPDEASPEKFMVRKAVTQRVAIEPMQFLTTTFVLTCDLARGVTGLGYRRELPVTGPIPKSVIGLKVGDTKLTFQARVRQGNVEIGVANARTYAVANVAGLQNVLASAAASEIALTETPRQMGADSLPSVIKLSTAGLKEAIVDFQQHCPSNTPIKAP